MATTTNTNGAIAAAVQQKAAVAQKSPAQKTLETYITKMQPAIAKALPSVITPERFTRMVFSAISTTPKLAECSPQSFMGAMMTAAQLGVEPNTPLGQAYLLPYKNHGNMECQFQLGYKGMIDLAYRSGEISSIQAHAVHANDEFRFSYGLHPSLEHVPAMGDRGEVICYYAVFQTKSEGFGFEVMSREDIEAHAKKYSPSFGRGYSSPWQTNFDEMAKKTVLKKALKYAPMKSDFMRGAASDGATITMADDGDLVSVPAEVEAEYTVVPETGEIVEEKENA